MFELKSDLKRFFFDRSAVSNAIDRGTRSALSKFGAFVRRADRSSLKYGAGKSAPGRPPVVHRTAGFTKSRKSRRTGAASRQPSSPLRELVFFAYDPAGKSVVVGPALFGGSKVGGGTAPRLIEEGGPGPVLSNGRLKRGHYAARPHLGPAYRATLPKAAAMFKSQIR